MESYPGGKNGAGVYQQIINLMPPHARYFELFLGAGAVMRHKRPASYQIGVEINPETLALWKGHDIPDLTLMQGDALDFLFERSFEKYDLVYCDPPYLMSTRSAKRAIYRHEFARADEHRLLLQELKMCRCMVMISGYNNALYEKELAVWRRLDFTTSTRGARRAVESVWCNFPEPLELHDYRWLGSNFRERERIKRRRERWKVRLLRMEPQERHAVLWALEQVREEASAAALARSGDGSGGSIIAENDDGISRSTIAENDDGRGHRRN
jgi:16S rRNA G966 N2-methylase RsmD